MSPCSAPWARAAVTSGARRAIIIMSLVAAGDEIQMSAELSTMKPWNRGGATPMIENV